MLSSVRSFGGFELKNVLDFLMDVGRLKKIFRTGWLESGVKKPESVADHSYRTTVIAMVISDFQGFDTEKVMRMSLLHDLAEVEMGDLTPKQKLESPFYSEEENSVMMKLLSKLPIALSKKYVSTWEEYASGGSPEAAIVSQADKLEMMLQAFEYESEGGFSESLEKFFNEVGNGPFSELAKSIMERKSRISK